jgi:hypothetical protein
MLHPYALVRTPAVVPETAGIDDAPLRAVSLVDPIEAVVTEMAAEIRPTDEAILAHARVVEAVSDVNDAVLPMRFSRGVVDEDELRRRLGGREHELSDALAHVAGCVEVGLRLIAGVDAAPQPPPASGREYMERRRGDVSRAEQVAGELSASLAALARDSVSRILAKSDVLLTAAYLVPRAELERFDSAVSAAAKRWPDLELVRTGPWPPYSFALLDPAPT